MRRPSETPAFTAVGDVLRGLSDTLAGAEDDLLSSLVVMGETDPQQTVDGWVDQIVDLLRAVDEVTVQHRATLTRASARHAVPDGVDAGSLTEAASRADDSAPSERR